MKSKYIDGLMGFTIGDALGLPLVDKKRDELLIHPVTKNIGEGQWSKATSMMLATVDSINAKLTIDYNDLALKFVAYKNHGSYTTNGESFGLTKACNVAIDTYTEDYDNPFCGIKDLYSNEALMRIAPVAYYAVEKHLKDLEILDITKKISSITNDNEISQMACYLFTRFAIFLLNGKDKLSAYSMTKCVDYTMFNENTRQEFERLVLDDISKLDIADIKSSDDVIDTLEATLWLILKSNNYRDAIIGAINLGGDTATIAALTGFLAGLIYGYEHIPEEWQTNLLKKEYILDIIDEFSENKY